MSARLLSALSASNWADILQSFCSSARRVFAFFVLTLSGLWRSLALALDSLASGLEHDWQESANRCGSIAPWPFRFVLNGVAWVIYLAARVAAVLRRLSAAHLRLAKGVDERLLRFAA